MAVSDVGHFDFVDSHLHLWDLATNRWYPALQEPLAEHDVGLGEMSALRRNYLLRDYQADSAGYNVSKLVHISATTSPRSYLEEIRWLDDMARQTGLPTAYIGSIEPSDDSAAIESDLAAQGESFLFRGARVMYGADPDSQSMRTLLSWLTEGGWVFDLVVHPTEVSPFVRLLQNYPSLEVVVEHCGWPDRPDEEHFAEWKKGLIALAALGKVNCKISGLPMTLHAVGGRFVPTVGRSLHRRVRSGAVPRRQQLSRRFAVWHLR